MLSKSECLSYFPDTPCMYNIHDFANVLIYIYVVFVSVARSELSTGRMDPRVGSGHDFAGFWRVGSGQHFGFISFY